MQNNPAYHKLVLRDTHRIFVDDKHQFSEYWTTVPYFQRALFLARWSLSSPFTRAGALPIGKAPLGPCSPSQGQCWASLREQGGGLVAGAAGTGKTWFLQQIVQSLIIENRNTLNIVCAAPTNKAVQRLGETMPSDVECVSIHRLLGMTPDSDASTRFVEADVLLIDEASMIDEVMFYNLITSIDFNATHLIIAGDPNQLMPVGVGSPFFDFCKNTECHTLIEQQRSGDGILAFANSILSEDVQLTANSQVFHIRDTSLLNKFRFNPKLHKHFGFHKSDHDRIIALCQTNEECNLIWSNLKRSFKYKQFDRVIFTDNNYTVGWKNGECGTIDPDKDNTVMSDTGRIYTDPDIGQHYSQAYALTVHKAQGSEWPIVFVKCDYCMDKNMFYTACTRARKGLVLFGNLPTKLVGDTRLSLLRMLLIRGDIKLSDAKEMI
jgi:exodeoxyribonuclease V alpha subunit